MTGIMMRTVTISNNNNSDYQNYDNQNDNDKQTRTNNSDNDNYDNDDANMIMQSAMSEGNALHHASCFPANSLNGHLDLVLVS